MAHSEGEGWLAHATRTLQAAGLRAGPGRAAVVEVLGRECRCLLSAQADRRPASRARRCRLNRDHVPGAGLLAVGIGVGETRPHVVDHRLGQRRARARYGVAREAFFFGQERLHAGPRP